MPAAALGRRRPRPVADVPVLDGREVARAWLVELVASAPLERATVLPGPSFSTDAPRLCGAIVAALSSEAAFDDLEPGGALALVAADAAVLAGADGGAEAVAALDALRGVLWSCLAESLERPPRGLLTDLADRLGAAIAAVTAATLEARSTVAATPATDRGPLAAVLRETHPPPAPHPPTDPSVAAANAAPVGRPTDPSAAAANAAPAGPPTDPSAAAGSPPDPTVAAATAAASPYEDRAAVREQRLRDLVGEDTAHRFASPPSAPVVEDGAGFHARVAPWTAAVERRLERFDVDRLPFAVLCVEVADLDRLVASERDGEVALALEAAEAAVCAQLRPADVLVRERPGRYWLVAPDTDAEGARSLAHLLAAAVAGVPGQRGIPLEVAVGVAAFPADGRDAPTLEGRAEEGLFAARAAGLRVTGPPRA